MRIIALDFDGTLCDNAFPAIGKAKPSVILRAQAAQREGAKLILWTCRDGELLKAALDWCLSHGLSFDAVNDNLPESVSAFGGNSRKIYATEYWDDKAVDPEPVTCMTCGSRKSTQSTKQRIYPWCAVSCKNYRRKE